MLFSRVQALGLKPPVKVGVIAALKRCATQNLTSAEALGDPKI
jgi:hypothetical protein